MKVDYDKLTLDLKIAMMVSVTSVVGFIVLFVCMIWSSTEYLSLVSKLIFTDIVVLLVSFIYYRILVYEDARDIRGDLVVREEFKISDDE